MLASLKVQGFRNFQEEIVFNFRTEKSYEFNTNVVKDGKARHSLVYGLNGFGKSNLGLAILDLKCHLTDHSITPLLHINYLNTPLNNESAIAEFEYEFEFGNSVVRYKYGKKKCNETVYESLEINDVLVVAIDRRVSELATYNLAGASGLKNDFTDKAISPVKFIASNALLDSDPINDTFTNFIKFVDGMVFFRTLTKGTESHGQPLEPKRVSQSIIEQGKLKDFEKFLNESGVECELVQAGTPGDERINFKFGKKSLEFASVASTGTISLGNFYYWYLKLLKGDITFAYIDEFDAYYHYALAESIVKLVAKTNCQSVITSHNSSLLSNYILRPDCYFILKKNSIKPLCELTDRELRKAHNLEKMFRSGAFDE